MTSAMSKAMAKSPKESPLASLVRRASSRRVRNPPLPTITFQYDHTPQEEPQSTIFQPPHSPLLHGHFARDSVATASSYEGNSYLESASSNSSRIQSYNSNVYPDSELDYRYHYDSPYEESVYSEPDMNAAALRNSWTSATTTSTVRPLGADMDQQPRTQWADSQQQQYYSPLPSPSAVPDIIVSDPEISPTPTAGRTPIVKPVSSNFSRPARPPPPIDGLEEQKRQVLLRNSNRQRSESPSSAAAGQRQPSSLRHQVSTGETGQPSSQQPWTSTSQPSSAVYTNSVASSSTRQLTANSSYTSNSSLMGSSQSSLSPRAHSPSTPQPPKMGALAPRADSSTSVYSNYSYYSYDTIIPSPTGSDFNSSADPFASRQRTPSNPNSKPNHTNSSLSSSPLSRDTPQKQPPPPSSSSSSDPQTPHDFLLLGIEHHEADRLKESARCFERSAVEKGGCGVGMLMWGLTLRHGWGCPKNEKLAFKWLQKAAESAVGDLEATRAKGIKDNSVVRTELILAIYEVGQCFFQGWGVPKDQKMAFSYYTIAAELGDPDAQMDLAFCLTNGKGCKKDKRGAAKWYRAAIKQGQSDVGLAWIYKDKYQ